jgi:hypothetical protein
MEGKGFEEKRLAVSGALLLERPRGLFGRRFPELQ